MKCLRVLWMFGALVGVVLAGGCSKTLEGSIQDGANFSRVSSMHVYMRDRDPNAEVLSILRAQLRERGYQVTVGLEREAPAGVDCMVEAQDKWHWDMTMYLLKFEVWFYEPGPGQLMASGKSRRTSILRQSPEFMVNEVLVQIFDTPASGTGS